MYNALFKNSPFQATGDQQRKKMGLNITGICRTLSYVDMPLSKMRQKTGVNGNQTSMCGYFGLF